MKIRGGGPDFLGIGPPKTATSWMYDALAAHPEVSMPPMKEIGYFWGRYFLPRSSVFSRFLGKHWFYQTRRNQLRESLRGHGKRILRLRPDFPGLSWDMRYLFRPHTEGWYLSLFDSTKASGDITPKYCELPAEEVRKIRSLLFPLKILVSFRDPVEREWSRAKMNLCKKRNRSPDSVPDEEWIEHFDRPLQAAANDYLAIYRRWADEFGAENVHMVFHEDLVSDAWRVYLDLCAFLGLSTPGDHLKEHVLRPKNVGTSEEIPPRFEHYLFHKHRLKIEEFSEAFPDIPHPKSWLERRQS